MINNDNVWKMLDAYYHSYPQDQRGAVDDKTLNALENILKVKFDTLYKKYISKYGGGFINAQPFYGVVGHNQMGDNLNNVSNVTKFYKEFQGWPGIEDWYIVSDDGFGNPIGIDPEGKVWLSDHDSGFEKVKLADSFEEFLYKVLTETLYE